MTTIKSHRAIDEIAGAKRSKRKLSRAKVRHQERSALGRSGNVTITTFWIQTSEPWSGTALGSDEMSGGSEVEEEFSIFHAAR